MTPADSHGLRLRWDETATASRDVVLAPTVALKPTPARPDRGVLAADLLRRHGRAALVFATLALFGASSGPVPPVDPQRLNTAGSVYLTRPSLAHFVRSPDEFAWRAGELIDAIAGGSITITVGGHYPLAEAQRAHEDLQARKTTGSIVLVP